MTIATDAFNAIYDSAETVGLLRCKIRIGRTVIAKAICAGLAITRENTDEGQFGGIDANVRLLAADEPGGEIAIGTVHEVLKEGADEKTGWIKVRVGGRISIGGITRLVLEAEHE